MRLLLPFFLVVALTLSCTSEEQFIYVKLSGDDLNEGSRKAPLKSLEQALVNAQNLRREENKAVTILLDEGTYHLANTIQINAENAGSEMAPLKIAGFPHERVILSGARVLKLEGEEAGNGVMKAIQSKFKYPHMAKELGIQGKVYVQFAIDGKGAIAGIRTRGPDTNLEKEASRIVSLLPKMTPGMQRGRAVRVPYSIPINFVLQ